jgi:hypothetical protein
MLPPDNEKRWRRMVVLVSPSEMDRIDDAAQRAGLSRGAFVRAAALCFDIASGPPGAPGQRDLHRHDERAA